MKRKYFISTFVPERNAFDSGIFETDLNLSTSAGIIKAKAELQRDLKSKNVVLLNYQELGCVIARVLR